MGGLGALYQSNSLPAVSNFRCASKTGNSAANGAEAPDFEQKGAYYRTPPYIATNDRNRASSEKLGF